jgi:protein arginine kinase activator
LLCPECGKRPATLHYTKILNGQKTEFHLCEVCAQEKEEHMPIFENGFSFHQLLSGLLNVETSIAENNANTIVQPQISLRCPTCGLTYNQFSKIGRFGCGDCYKTFHDRLTPLLRRIHGNSTHRGKIPERTKGELKVRRELEKLKELLSVKVREEAFEEAAKIRDQIRLLQERLQS